MAEDTSASGAVCAKRMCAAAALRSGPATVHVSTAHAVPDHVSGLDSSDHTIKIDSHKWLSIYL